MRIRMAFESRLRQSFLLLGLVLPIGASALTVKSFLPANGALDWCLDTPLRMVLSGKPSLAWSGGIRIRDLTQAKVVHTWTFDQNPGNPQTISVGADWPWQDSVGHTWRNVWPVVVDSIPEHLVEIRVPQHLLQPAHRYQIEVDAGILKGADGSAFTGVAAGSWSFTTTKTRPGTRTEIVVSQDNSGDACSVQGGIELAPNSSKSPARILIQPGYYREMVAAKNKNNLRLYGPGASKTFLRYFNSNNLNTAGSAQRNLMLLSGNGNHLRGFSIINTAGVTAGQAEALYLQGDTNVVADMFLHSFQDTWLNSGGRAYVQDATLEGSVDFIWGYNPVFFKRCTLVVNRTGGVVVQPRNTDTHGYVFDSCRLEAFASGYSGVHFARDAGLSFPNGEVRFLNTTIVDGSFLAASPWTVNSGVDESKLGFCEYQSRDQNGRLLAISDAQRKRLQCPADTAERHADPSFVLGGWNPFVPDFGSVRSLFPVATVERPGGVAGELGHLRKAGRRQELVIQSEGVSMAREIRPDGRSRELVNCQGSCTVEYRPSARVAWIEITSGERRSILAAGFSGI